MDMTRRNFIGGLGAGAALAAMPGCGTAVCRAARPGKVALQLYSIRDYIKKTGLAKALADVKAIGYEG
ncbi:MAG TPA: sugar phosphate isomerase/epimerase, partial [Verrucomicrobia bacterium]|nr:sugar phosphate isomerase/epimerase [Verrucomicrobiota bacterium]